MSKWEFELENQENLGPKVSGRLQGGIWTALDPFLDRPSPSKASKSLKSNFYPPAGQFPIFTAIFDIGPGD